MVRKITKIGLISVTLICAPAAVGAQTTFTVFNRCNAQYRIPSIVECKSGKIIAFSDNRHDNKDIGGGRRLDIVTKTCDAKTRAWSMQEDTIARGSVRDANNFDCAHGDAATVVDRKSGRLLMMCASGGIGYWESTRQSPIMMGRYYSDDEGNTWYGEDCTKEIYDIIPDIEQAFFSSGRICQSSKIKAGKYYRVYSVLATRKGNRVLYSDDFGKVWKALGTNCDKCAPNGDEAKVEELPDGSLLLSSRVSAGRIFNIFTYSDKKKAIGQWSEPMTSTKNCNGIAASSNACNGEIIIVPAKDNSGKKVWLMLQSVPLGPQRTNVAIFYKTLDRNKDYCVEDICKDWEGYYQVSNMTSAYSTMVAAKDGSIHFLYEEDAFKIPETQPDDYYNIVYKNLSIRLITNSTYTAWRK